MSVNPYNKTPESSSGSPSGLILMDALGTPTYTTLQDWMNTTQSSGIITGGIISDGGLGLIDISAMQAVVKIANTNVGGNVFFELGTSVGASLTDNDTNYVMLDYNGGAPQVLISVTDTSNRHTIFMIGIVYREGTTVDIIQSGVNLSDFDSRVQLHHIEEEALHFVSGAVVSETGVVNIGITAGVMYAGLNRIITDAIDTSGASTFEYYYNDGAWQESDESAIDELQYNNFGVGLATLTNNRYGVHWVYKGTNSTTYVVYGLGDYLLTQAQNAQPPASLPDHVQNFGVLRAKIIIQKSAVVFTEIESVTDTAFSAQTASNHNELGGLQGGAADEYNHLDNADAAANVIKTGTPLVNQVAVHTDANTVQGDPALAWDGLVLSVDGDVNVSRASFYDEMWSKLAPEWVARVSTGTSAAVGARGGQWRLTTGATATNEESIDFDDIFPVFADIRPALETSLIIQDIANTEVDIGFAGSNAADFVYISFDASVDGNWHLKTSKNGGSTADDSGSAVVASPTSTTLKLVWTGATTIEWFINGVSQGTISTAAAIPTVALQPVVGIRTEENVAHWMQMNYVKFWADHS